MYGVGPCHKMAIEAGLDQLVARKAGVLLANGMYGVSKCRSYLESVDTRIYISALPSLAQQIITPAGGPWAPNRWRSCFAYYDLADSYEGTNYRWNCFDTNFGCRSTAINDTGIGPSVYPGSGLRECTSGDSQDCEYTPDIWCFKMPEWEFDNWPDMPLESPYGFDLRSLLGHTAGVVPMRRADSSHAWVTTPCGTVSGPWLLNYWSTGYTVGAAIIFQGNWPATTAMLYLINSSGAAARYWDASEALDWQSDDPASASMTFVESGGPAENWPASITITKNTAGHSWSFALSGMNDAKLNDTFMLPKYYKTISGGTDTQANQYPAGGWVFAYINQVVF